MRDVTKATISVMWAGWISAVRQGTVMLFPDDDFRATFDAVYVAGDNIQRGVVDIVAGLLGGGLSAPDAGSNTGEEAGAAERTGEGC